MSQLTLREFIPGAAPAFALANARIEAVQEKSRGAWSLRAAAINAHHRRTVLNLLTRHGRLDSRTLHGFVAEVARARGQAPITSTRLLQILRAMKDEGLIEYEVVSEGRHGRRGWASLSRVTVDDDE